MNDTIYIILFLILGLIVGSFLNVIVFRMDDLKSIINTRSHCTNCKKTIAWYDLIPFLSFFILRAKCRNCGEKISAQYPMVEAGTGLLFLFLYLIFGLSWSLVFYIVLFSLLVVVMVYDIRTQTVPEMIVYIAVALSLLGGWYFGGFGFWEMIKGGIIGGGFIWLLVAISREKWMGAGDIKIGLILGLLTGYPTAIFALFFAFVFGSVIGGLILLLKRGGLKTAIPFAPFLILAILFTLSYGRIIVYWYMNLFVPR